MSQMALPNQMKRRRKEKGHECADQIVPKAVRKKDGVLRLMNRGINGVHYDAEYNSQDGETPPALDLRSRIATSGNGSNLEEDDEYVQLRGDLHFRGALRRGRHLCRFHHHDSEYDKLSAGLNFKAFGS